MKLKLVRVKDLKFGEPFTVYGPTYVRSLGTRSNSYVPFYKTGDSRERALHPDMVVASVSQREYLYTSIVAALQTGQSFRYRGKTYITTAKHGAETEAISEGGALTYLPNHCIVSTMRV